MTASDPRSSPSIPWYLWLAALSVTSAIVGGQWDISWHRSIGRDTFLTPAHIAIYLCGILAALYCGYLILSATFVKTGARAASVKVWWFYGPLGAFVAAWGGFLMLTSAPFDDWWHGAYGLDVKILSPPHVMLALGIFAVQAGVVLLVAAQRNRAEAKSRNMLDWLFIYVGAMGLLLLMAVTLEYNALPLQHSAAFYEAMCITIPLTLSLIARASGRPFAATKVAGIYTLVMLGFNWILPLFPAQPKLGPVYHQVTHFVSPGFPMLLIVPALALDLFWLRFPKMNVWMKSAVSGLLFLATFAAVQWPFGDFLQSPAAQNAVFSGNNLDYLAGPNSLMARHLFAAFEHTPKEFWTGMAWALLWAILAVRVGFARGSALSEVKR